MFFLLFSASENGFLCSPRIQSTPPQMSSLLPLVVACGLIWWFQRVRFWRSSSAFGGNLFSKFPCSLIYYHFKLKFIITAVVWLYYWHTKNIGLVWWLEGDWMQKFWFILLLIAYFQDPLSAFVSPANFKQAIFVHRWDNMLIAPKLKFDPSDPPKTYTIIVFALLTLCPGYTQWMGRLPAHRIVLDFYNKYLISYRGEFL